MISGAHKGEWFLPWKQKFPGQLLIDNKKETIHLEIYGSMYIEGISVDTDVYPEHFHTIIMGDHPMCTLYNCHWAGSLEVGLNLYRITYRIEYVFIGYHFADPEILVRGGTFVYAHLATWYDGSELHDKLEGKKGLWVDSKEVTQNVLSREQLQINSELKLVFWDEVNKRIEQLDISYRVEYDKYIEFQYETCTSLKRLLKDAITFLKLLSFSFGKPLNLFMIYIYADKTNVSGSKDFDLFNLYDKQLIYVNNYTLKQGKEIPKHCYHSRLQFYNSPNYSPSFMNCKLFLKVLIPMMTVKICFI